MRRLLLTLVIAATAAAACATPTEPDQAAPTPATVTSETPTVFAQSDDTSSAAAATAPAYAQMLAVGDIASCDTTGDEKVAALAKKRGGRIALLGDVVYPSATAANFRDCFDPAWGSMADRFRPALGNHEYHVDAAAYWDYFGDWSGTRGKGWYAYNAGPYWRVIVLNSNCTRVGGCGRYSPQGKWLAGALERAGDRHVLAYFHHPRFSSGRHGSTTSVKPLWRQLYRARADVVLSGHDHHYERFAPQNPDGQRRRNGIQQFIVGTGGYKFYDFGGPPLANTAVRDNTTFGLLLLRLRETGYSWWFLPAVGDFTDKGSRRLS